MAVYGTSTNWVDTSIAWNNQPALGAYGSTTTVGHDIGWYHWDVTNLVGNGGLVAMALTSNGPGQVLRLPEKMNALKAL